MKMKLYLVKFNRPLLINNGTEEEKKYTPLYGFYYEHNWSEEHCLSIDDLNQYICYLAAIHEWSNNSSADFSLETPDTWIDNKSGEKHSIGGDLWSYVLGEQCLSKLDLRGTIYVLDIEEESDIFLNEGFDGHFIITESLMDELIELTIEQMVRKRVWVFNRPIWLPKKHIWGEDGFCHIYGLITDDFELDEKNAADIHFCYFYLGYLALCEEFYLTETTPNGFSTIEGETWYKDGIAYDARSKEIQEECSICVEKSNLEIRTNLIRIPAYDLAEGTRDDLIIDQEFYERVLSATPKDKVGCPK
ncbi:MAG: hypothetical protein II659_04060 [Bacteroidales bacterium]|nr:hypothetical protein [Bacteroidales bacterium]